MRVKPVACARLDGRSVESASQDRDWRHFVTWCRARGLRSLPAHPWTMAAYARSCERRHRHATIVRRLAAIARMHVLHRHDSPDRHPTVTRTLRVMAARAGRSRVVLFRPRDFLEPDVPDGATQDGNVGETRARRVLRTTPRLVARRSRRV